MLRAFRHPGPRPQGSAPMALWSSRQTFKSHSEWFGQRLRELKRDCEAALEVAPRQIEEGECAKGAVTEIWAVRLWFMRMSSHPQIGAQMDDVQG